MSNIKDQVEVDIKRFFEQIETQNSNDQLQTLRNLLDKYVHLSTSEHLLGYYDLNQIISSAKHKMANDKVELYLQSGSRKTKLTQDQIPNLFVIEATIGYLNKLECLKKLAKFDYKDNKY